MEKIRVYGGHHLSGSVDISTSKNAVLPILAASVLCEEQIIIHKFPIYEDTKSMLEILSSLGAKYHFENGSVIIEPKFIEKFEIPSILTNKLRSSIFMMGALVGRLKKARISFPGGCAIGARPIDLHIKGLKCLGVKIDEIHGFINCNVKTLKGNVINLDFPSVGATENIIMASVYAKGITQIHNPAKEPEIVDLQDFLNAMGARVYGAGTDTITIEGVKKLHGTAYTPIPDRIITGTYILATAISGGKVELNHTRPETIASLIGKLKNNCCQIDVVSDKIIVSCDKRPKCISKVETLPYPGFPTDLQAPMMSMLAVARGTSVIIENLFESRFKHVGELNKLGAKILVNDRTAIINGVPMLCGADVMATDLRGGAALVIAGLNAKGYTTISDVHHIDRGYEHIEKDLQSLGANIERIYSET